MWKLVLKNLFTLFSIVLLSCLVETGFLYYQVTRGKKLPFKLRLFPVIGNDF